MYYSISCDKETDERYKTCEHGEEKTGTLPEVVARHRGYKPSGRHCLRCRSRLSGDELF